MLVRHRRAEDRANEFTPQLLFFPASPAFLVPYAIGEMSCDLQYGFIDNRKWNRAYHEILTGKIGLIRLRIESVRVVDLPCRMNSRIERMSSAQKTRL